MQSSPLLMQSSQIFRARTDVGINCDAKLVSKLIINKIRMILDQEKKQGAKNSEQQQVQEEVHVNLLDSTGDVNKTSIPYSFRINIQRASSCQPTQTYYYQTRKSLQKSQNLFGRQQSNQQSALSELKRGINPISSPIAGQTKPQSNKRFNFSLNIHQIHPLSPKRGMATKFFSEDEQLKIEEQPKISKRNHFKKLNSISGKKASDRSAQNLYGQLQETKGVDRAPSAFYIQNNQTASLICKESPKSIHPLNNVVKIFFGKKGFINFLNIIRRSLKGRKGDNSISFKQDLVSELIAIKQKFNLCRSNNNGSEKEYEVSQQLNNTHQGDQVTFEEQEMIQVQSNYPDTVSDSDVGSLLMRPVSAAIQNVKISEPCSKCQSSYLKQIEAARPKQSNSQSLDKYASTKNQKSSRSVSTLPQTSILNFQYSSFKICKEFYQFHYFCASHLERYGDHSMWKQVLNCYIDGGKIKNECVPGKVIEIYLSQLNKAEIQALHGKFFKQVIKTKPLLSRIISKVKQKKSKAMLRDKIQRIKTDRMTNSRGSVSTDFQNTSRFGRIQNFTINSKLNKDFDKKQSVDESLKLSIDALSDLRKYINQCEDKYQKRQKVTDNSRIINVYKQKEFNKISQKYLQMYKKLDNFPKDSQTRAMFLLNAINFTILLRLIERLNQNTPPLSVYIWSQFLKQASIFINQRRFNLLELINVFLRNEASRIYQIPVIHQMIKWPKYNDINLKSQLDFDLTVKEKYSDISLGIHFPLKQMPGFHIFNNQSTLEHQLQKIKHHYLNKFMRFQMQEAQKMIVTVPQYFDWFILDFVEEADVVERQSLFIAQIANLSLNQRFQELRERFENADIAISLEFSPVKWMAYKHLCQ